MEKLENFSRKAEIDSLARWSFDVKFVCSIPRLLSNVLNSSERKRLLVIGNLSSEEHIAVYCKEMAERCTFSSLAFEVLCLLQDVSITGAPSFQTIMNRLESTRGEQLQGPTAKREGHRFHSLICKLLKSMQESAASEAYIIRQEHQTAVSGLLALLQSTITKRRSLPHRYLDELSGMDVYGKDRTEALAHVAICAAAVHPWSLQDAFNIREWTMQLENHIHYVSLFFHRSVGGGHIPVYHVPWSPQWTLQAAAALDPTSDMALSPASARAIRELEQIKVLLSA